MTEFNHTRLLDSPTTLSDRLSIWLDEQFGEYRKFYVYQALAAGKQVKVVLKHDSPAPTVDEDPVLLETTDRRAGFPTDDLKLRIMMLV